MTVKVDQTFRVLASPSETRMLHLPPGADLDLAVITTDQDIWLSIDGLHHGGGQGQTRLLAGETITIEKPSGNTIEIHGGDRRAEVTAILCYYRDPSAVDQLGDLVRDARR